MITQRCIISRKRSLVESIVPIDTRPKKIIRVASSLPPRLLLSESAKKSSKTSPEQCFIACLESEGIKAQIHNFRSVQHLFEHPKREEIEAYGLKAIEAVRKRDVEGLRGLLAEGHPLKCSNKHGESILHLACRKAFVEVADFLINEAQVPLWVMDDFGRNPCHDACWTVEPNFQLMDLIIEKCPDLLLISDARGHTPLAYVRHSHWEQWIDYLTAKAKCLRPTKLP